MTRKKFIYWGLDPHYKFKVSITLPDLQSDQQIAIHDLDRLCKYLSTIKDSLFIKKSGNSEPVFVGNIKVDKIPLERIKLVRNRNIIILNKTI